MREDYTFCPKNPLSVIAQTCLKHNFQSYRFGWPEIEKQSNEKKMNMTLILLRADYTFGLELFETTAIT